MNNSPQAYLIQIRDLLIEHYNAAELKDLCFQLGLDYDDIAGSGRSGKARELVTFLKRRGRLGELETAVSTLNPSVIWPLPPGAQPKSNKNSGIPTNLNGQLRATLLDCGAFSTDQELRAVFVDQTLSPWKNHIPQANTPAQRVELVINFLHNKQNNVGQNGLVLLLRALSGRLDAGTQCHHRLEDVASEYEQVTG